MLLRSGDLPRSGGVPATVIITANLEQVQEAAAYARGDASWGAPTTSFTTADGMRLSVSQMLKVAGEARIVPAFMNTAGGITAYGTSRRYASPGQVAALIARDFGCSFPDCDAPPQWCEAHHVVPWIAGGPTDLDNLTLVCGYHHRDFERREWDCRMINGTPHWIPPSRVDPDRRPLRNRRLLEPDPQLSVASETLGLPVEPGMTAKPEGAVEPELPSVPERSPDPGRSPDPERSPDPGRSPDPELPVDRQPTGDPRPAPLVDQSDEAVPDRKRSDEPEPERKRSGGPEVAACSSATTTPVRVTVKLPRLPERVERARELARTAERLIDRCRMGDVADRGIGPDLTDRRVDRRIAPDLADAVDDAIASWVESALGTAFDDTDGDWPAADASATPFAIDLCGT